MSPSELLLAHPDDSAMWAGGTLTWSVWVSFFLSFSLCTSEQVIAFSGPHFSHHRSGAWLRRWVEMSAGID